MKIRLNLMALDRSSGQVIGNISQIDDCIMNLSLEKITESLLKITLNSLSIDEALREINKVSLIGETIDDAGDKSCNIIDLRNSKILFRLVGERNFAELKGE